jgi:hypothetical protein
MDFNSRLEAWAGLIWLMIGAGSGFGVELHIQLNLGFFLLAEELVASQEGLLHGVR